MDKCFNGIKYKQSILKNNNIQLSEKYNCNLDKKFTKKQILAIHAVYVCNTQSTIENQYDINDVRHERYLILLNVSITHFSFYIPSLIKLQNEKG